MGRRILSLISRAGFYSVSPLLRLVEGLFWPGRYEEMASQQAPIFIVGAPRTGSTILYQAITNVYQVQYIDNAACLLHRNLRFGLWISRILYSDSSHANFHAQYGDTRGFGGHAPSECGAFWYRWLPRDRHFIDFPDITCAMISGLRREIAGSTRAVNKPLLFKNLNAGQRLRLISRAFPDARIIFIRRDPRFVIRSILRARKELGVKPGEWWSIMPQNMTDLKELPEPQMVAAQVFHLEAQIEWDLRLFDVDKVRVVHYNDLNPALVRSLGEWLQVEPRSFGDFPEFRPDDPESFLHDERKFLDEVVASFGFKKELFV